MELNLTKSIYWFDFDSTPPGLSGQRYDHTRRQACGYMISTPPGYVARAVVIPAGKTAVT